MYAYEAKRNNGVNKDSHKLILANQLQNLLRAPHYILTRKKAFRVETKHVFKVARKSVIETNLICNQVGLRVFVRWPNTVCARFVCDAIECALGLW